VPVIFCANVAQGDIQTEWLKADILRACEAGVSGVVIADLALLSWAARRAQGRTIIASTMTAISNSKALDFLARAGARRVVLERLLTLSEIEAMAAHARAIGLELEVFVNNQGCLHVNGLCHYHEWFLAKLGPEPGRAQRVMPCRAALPLKVWAKAGDSYRRTGPQRRQEPSALPRNCRRDVRALSEEKKRADHSPAALAFDCYSCAACSLLRLEAAGVAYAKVVHRHFSLARKVRLVSMMKEYLTLLKKGRIGPGEHISAGRRLFRKHHGRDCLREYCFHREIWAQRGETA